MLGGVGIRWARCSVRNSTSSAVTGWRKGSASTGTSGKSSWNGAGFTTAPDRLCSPSADAFSSTATCKSPPVDWFNRASSIAAASPAGPAPTTTTSISIASGSGASCTISCWCGSSGWWRAGMMRWGMEASPVRGSDCPREGHDDRLHEVIEVVLRPKPPHDAPDPGRCRRFEVHTLMRSMPEPHPAAQQVLGFPGVVLVHADHIHREHQRGVVRREGIQVHRDKDGVRPIWRGLLIEEHLVVVAEVKAQVVVLL